MIKISTFLLSAAIAAATVLAACNKTDDNSHASPAAAAVATNPAPVVLDPRGPTDLATALDKAQQADDPEREYSRLRKSWLGKRVRWTAKLLPALCAKAERCNVVVWDHAARKDGFTQGWMPRLRMDDGQYAHLLAACRTDKSCEFKFEGRVNQLIAGSDEFTSIAFDNVDFVERVDG